MAISKSFKKANLQLIMSFSINAFALFVLTYQTPTQHNGQTHSNNSSATADELFEYV